MQHDDQVPGSGFDGPTQGSTLVAEVLAREAAWRDAWLSSDVSALEGLHHADYYAINNIGHVTTRAQILADVRAGLFRYQSMRHEGRQVRVYGSMALVTGTTINKGQRGTRDVSGTFAYTRAYLNDAGIWRAVLAQYTRVS
ncbi:MAG: nuclear transport factor 2 family protein [Nostoc sp. CmiVER01]|uniref:nuclear transport factor 2 family protein n=1 Tax=Nostoc sp. CmiVER01 TaxID=3075384 RepID=UPI003D1619C3